MELLIEMNGVELEMGVVATDHAGGEGVQVVEFVIGVISELASEIQ